MNKKGDISARNFMITLALVVGVMVSFGTASVSLARDYSPLGVTAIDDTRYNEAYNQLDDVTAQAEKLDDTIQQADLGTLDSQTQFYGDITAALKLGMQSLGATTAMVTNAVSDLGIPTFWYQIFLLIIAVTVLFSIIYTFFTKPS